MLSQRDRTGIATQAMQAAVRTRLFAKRDLVSATCVYEVAKAHGVHVLFTEIDMEGMYQRSLPPRIFLSSRRPLVRRIFNCAHELGHHVLGHGSTIDELQTRSEGRPWDIPEEYAADTFAANFLMPTLGIRRAFASRGLRPGTARSDQLFRIACEFGVGYRTLVTHLLWSEKTIDRRRAEELKRETPKLIREYFLGNPSDNPLIVVDHLWNSQVVDGEVGHLILTPAGTLSQGHALRFVADLHTGRLLEAVRPGICRLAIGSNAGGMFARIARRSYVGRAEFRHLEDEEHD